MTRRMRHARFCAPPPAGVAEARTKTRSAKRNTTRESCRVKHRNASRKAHLLNPAGTYPPSAPLPSSAPPLAPPYAPPATPRHSPLRGVASTRKPALPPVPSQFSNRRAIARGVASAWKKAPPPADPARTGFGCPAMEQCRVALRPQCLLVSRHETPRRPPGAEKKRVCGVCTCAADKKLVHGGDKAAAPDSTGTRAAVRMRRQHDGHRSAGKKAARQTKDEKEGIKKDNRERTKETKETDQRRKERKEEVKRNTIHTSRVLDLEAAREDGRNAEEAAQEGEGGCGRADEYGKRMRTKNAQRGNHLSTGTSNIRRRARRAARGAASTGASPNAGVLASSAACSTSTLSSGSVYAWSVRRVRARGAGVAKEFCRRSKGEGSAAEEAHTNHRFEQSRCGEIIVGIGAAKKGQASACTREYERVYRNIVCGRRRRRTRWASGTYSASAHGMG
ncbi:hypothetical protein C8J57DRAFT_1236140 [Mycena rebaudengoi]|nr:hypothetical protein C8J57DRAFT_1236140 [Mycena rebaudengoi]